MQKKICIVMMCSVSLVAYGSGMSIKERQAALAAAQEKPATPLKKGSPLPKPNARVAALATQLAHKSTLYTRKTDATSVAVLAHTARIQTLNLLAAQSSPVSADNEKTTSQTNEQSILSSAKFTNSTSESVNEQDLSASVQTTARDSAAASATKTPKRFVYAAQNNDDFESDDRTNNENEPKAASTFFQSTALKQAFANQLAQTLALGNPRDSKKGTNNHSKEAAILVPSDEELDSVTFKKALKHLQAGDITWLRAQKDAGKLDIQQRNEFGSTLLHTAVYIPVNRMEILEFLIAAGIDVHAANHKKITPLHIAAAHGCLDALELLVARGADLKITDTDGYTAFHYAVGGNNAQCLHKLKELGANIKARDNENNNAVMMAAMNGQDNALEALLAMGLSGKIDNLDGCTLLQEVQTTMARIQLNDVEQRRYERVLQLLSETK